MPFSERTKFEAKYRAAFRCCVCHEPFVEVHHIVPQAAGGSDTLGNAATLCGSCHDLYGGNPDKRKALKQMRDAWWSLIAERNARLTDISEPDPPFVISRDPHYMGGLRSSQNVLYHCVMQHEDFNSSAASIFKLVQDTQRRFPNLRRLLALDIEGHRDRRGRFDEDMFELQANFLGQFIIQYVTEVYTPLLRVKNTKVQNNSVPKKLHFMSGRFERTIANAVEKGVGGIWLASEGAMLRITKPNVASVVQGRSVGVKLSRRRAK